MEKFYAVKKGRNPGIYENWDKCKRQIDGFSGAIYKSFKTKAEALEYLHGNKLETKDLNRDSKWEVVAYVDGSYSEEKSIYSYGCVITVGEKEKIKFNGIGRNLDYLEMRNVAGELLGVKKAIQWAYENNYKSIQICYDYKGIESWATDEWKANKKGTQQYKSFIQEYTDKIEIGFLKIKAHSGNILNDMADKLAADAINNFNNENIIHNKELKKDENIELLDLFLKVENSKVKKKEFEWIFEDITLSESRIDNFIKKHWLNIGNKIKDLNSYTVKIDIVNNNISWDVIDKNDKRYSFILKEIFKRGSHGRL